MDIICGKSTAGYSCWRSIIQYVRFLSPTKEILRRLRPAHRRGLLHGHRLFLRDIPQLSLRPSRTRLNQLTRTIFRRILQVLYSQRTIQRRRLTGQHTRRLPNQLHDQLFIQRPRHLQILLATHRPSHLLARACFPRYRAQNSFKLSFTPNNYCSSASLPHQRRSPAMSKPWRLP